MRLWTNGEETVAATGHAELVRITADVDADDFQGGWDAGEWRALPDDQPVAIDFSWFSAGLNRLHALKKARITAAATTKLDALDGFRAGTTEIYTLTAREWAEGHTDTAPDAFRLVASTNI